MLNDSYSPNMPVAQYALAFSRQMIWTLNGKRRIHYVLSKCPKGANYFDINSNRYAVNVGQMNSRGICKIEYIENGRISIEAVAYPEIVKLSDLIFSERADMRDSEKRQQTRKMISVGFCGSARRVIR